MNSKKCFILAVTLLTFLIGLNTTLWGQEQKDPNQDPNDKIKLLEEKVERLKGIIETQQKTNNRLEKENEQLKRLCSQAGIDISLQKDKEPSEVESKKWTKVSIEQLCQLGITNSQLTTVQREKLYKENEKLYEKMYAGKYVQWTGKVSSVKRIGKGYVMSFLHLSVLGFVGRFRITSQTTVTVKFPEDELLERRILSLNEGSVVTYEGKLPDSYDEIRSLSIDLISNTLSLTDGRIIKYP